MNILFTVHHFLDLNAGAAGATHDLATEYRRLGHSVEIYSFDDLPLPRLISGRERQLLFPYFAAAHVARRLVRGRVDVIDASSGDMWLFALLARRRRLPRRPLLVTRSHGLEQRVHREVVADADRGSVRLSWKYPLYHGGWRLIEVCLSFRRSDLSIVLNRTDEQHVVGDLGVQPERVRVIPHGLPDSFLELRMQPVPAERSPRLSIAYIGRRDFRKGYDHLVEALSEVLPRNRDLSVGFFGTLCAPDDILRDFEPGVRGQIRVVPEYARSDLPELLAGYHIKVFPTLGEGFGLALLEAMACGLAPIASAVSGPLEIVTDGHDGILVPPRDARAIADAIEGLISDLPRLETLRKSARETAQAFRWDVVAERTLDTYREFLGEGPRPGSADGDRHSEALRVG